MSNQHNEQLSNVFKPFVELIKFGNEKKLTAELLHINDKTILTIPLNELGETALHIAASCNKSIIPCLLQLGANPTLNNVNGENALQLLFKENQVDISLCAMMIQYGASLYTKDEDGETILDFMIRRIFKLIYNNYHDNKINLGSDSISTFAAAKKNEMIQLALSSLLPALGNSTEIQKLLECKYDNIIKTQKRLENNINKVSQYLENMLHSTTNDADRGDIFIRAKVEFENISIKKYLEDLAYSVDRIYLYNPLTSLYFTAMLSCLECYLEKNNKKLTQDNVHALILTSFTIAYKYIKDSNQADIHDIARIGNIPTPDLAIMERHFLKNIDYIIPINSIHIQNTINRINNDEISVTPNEINFSPTLFAHNRATNENTNREVNDTQMKLHFG